jgi:hypothetical protein
MKHLILLLLIIILICGLSACADQGGSSTMENVTIDNNTVVDLTTSFYPPSPQAYINQL